MQTVVAVKNLLKKNIFVRYAINTTTVTNAGTTIHISVPGVIKLTVSCVIIGE